MTHPSRRPACIRTRATRAAPGRPGLRDLVAALALSALVAGAAQAQTAPSEAAVRAATEGYARLNEGNLDAAIEAARRAVDAAPGALDYRLLLADALLRAGRNREAYVALEPVADISDYRVQSRRAQAAGGTGLKAEAAAAFGLAAGLATEPESRAYLTRAHIQALLDIKDPAGARTAFDTAIANGVLTGQAPLDTAMVAIAVGDDAAAQVAFAEAGRSEPLSGRVALDAGYSARRLGRDADALRYFSRGIDEGEAGRLDLEPQQVFEIRREISTLERRWGASATISRGVASTDSAATPGAETLTQLGAEAYYRLGGYRNGAPVDLFVRAYETLDADRGSATGSDTAQGWIGLRWKPFTRTNLVLEASKMFAIGELARDDLMVRASWSLDQGGDLRLDRVSWPSRRLYGDVAHIVDDDQTLGVAEARTGWSWRTGDRAVITPFIGIRGYYDSLLKDSVAVGVGPGLSGRRWFGGNRYAAPSSYLEGVIGYGFSISGDDRGDGLFVALSINY